MSAESHIRNGQFSEPSQSIIIGDGTAANDMEWPKVANKKRLAIVRAKIMSLEFFAVVTSAFLASIFYQVAVLSSSAPLKQYLVSALFLGALVSLTSVGFQHFSSIQTRPLHTLLWSGIGAVGLAFLSLLSTIFLLKITSDYSRGTFIFQVVCVAGVVLGVRMSCHSWIRSAIAAGTIKARHVVLIGDATSCAQFRERLSVSAIESAASFRSPWSRHKTIEADVAQSAGRKVKKLIEACRAIRPDDIIILANQEELPKTMSLASSLSELPVGLHIIPVDALELFAGFHIGEFGGLLTIQVHRPPLSPFDLAVKRLFDIFVALFALIVLSPLFLVVSIAIKLDTAGPIFFRQMRHGFNNEPIRVLKFRSMTTLERGDRFTQAVKDDPRVTRVGRILRRTNIDELPQLINVLQGDMSIVGPRPHATAHNSFFQEKITPFSRRHTVKPGITGWAQVNGLRGETDTLEKMQRRVEHDLYYIDNWSFLFDMKIILLTVLSKRAYTNAC
jgi:Undecaprenyl-phosphate glucose phosphotransferase